MKESPSHLIDHTAHAEIGSNFRTASTDIMSGAPPNLMDLKAFVDCCCNKNVRDTRVELDNRTGPPGTIDIRNWLMAADYAHDRLLAVFGETKLLTRRAVDISRAYPTNPVRIAIR